MDSTLVGKVISVLIGLQADSLITSPVDQVQVTLEGFSGDKHSGITRPSDSRTPHYPRGTIIRNDRQVSIISVEEMEAVAARLGVPEIRPEWLGANLLLAGIPNLTRLPPSTRLFFQQGVTLYISAENNPCIHPGKIIQSMYPELSDLENAFVKAATHLRGLVAVVEKTGSIAQGEPVKVKIPGQYRYTLEKHGKS